MDNIIELITREIEEMQEEDMGVVKEPVKKVKDETKRALHVDETLTLKMKGKMNDAVNTSRTNSNFNNTNDMVESVKTTLIVVQPFNGVTMKESKTQNVSATAKRADIQSWIEEIPKMGNLTRILEWIAEASYSVPVQESDIINVINYDITPDATDDDFELGDESCLYNLKLQIIKDRNRPRRRVRRKAKRKSIKKPTEAQKDISPPVVNNAIILMDTVESSPAHTDKAETVPAQTAEKIEKKGFGARFVKRIQGLFSCFRPTRHAMANAE